MADQRFYDLPPEETAKILNTSLETGLGVSEAAKRLSQFGPNQLLEKKAATPLAIFFEQFQDFIIWVLIGAALVSGFLKEWVDALAIITIVILNAILGFIQEYRAEKSLAALKKLSSPTSKVIRGRERSVITSKDLVPGDLIELEAGDNIPADSRLVWATSNFSAQEASLTGESTPVAKTIIALEEKDVPLAERANMVYMGTSIALGKARAIVVKTGMETELGKIAGMVQEIKQEETPLQKKLEEFGKWVVYLCFALVTLVFLLEWVRGGKMIDVFLTAVSLAVAAIPEGLPAVVTIALALGVHRMVKRHALIRKLPSVETLGCATVICSDKTGTLTKNEMTVQAVFAGSQLIKVTGIGYEPKGEFLFSGKQIKPLDYPDLNKTLLCAVLCNGAQLILNSAGVKMTGDPTEGALLTLAAKAGIFKEEKEREFAFVDEIPFDSERKKMTVIRKAQDKFFCFVKGAPDVLLNDCTDIEEKGVVRSISQEDRGNILAVNNDLSSSAMRVLAVAYKAVDEPQDKYEANVIERGLTFLGLIAMIDPPREEVKKAIGECEAAGIKTVMITGDHKNTAVAIARQLGFFKDNSIALTGEELDKLSDEEFFKVVEKIPVYARVSPEHKLRIVRAWRKRKEIVAMTGDGVNDAPALKKADIGVSMGKSGSEVAKDAASLILVDDSFGTIVKAVHEGRVIYDNILKFIWYMLGANIGEVLAIAFSLIFMTGSPLAPIQLLWINLLTDGLPALALGVEPPESGIMKRMPRDPKQKFLSGKVLWGIIFRAIAFGIAVYGSYLIGSARGGHILGSTYAFATTVITELLVGYTCRSFTKTIFEMKLWGNPQLLGAIAVSLAMFSITFIPSLQPIFKTTGISMVDLGIIILMALIPPLFVDISKLFLRRYAK